MNPAKQTAVKARVREVMTQLPRSAFSAIEAGQSESCDASVSWVAVMLEALALSGAERVLEIGSSSGYETALLSKLAHDVVSLEGDQAEAEARLRRLTSLGCENVRIFLSQGSAGWPGEGPYHAILVARGASRVPTALLDQLAIGGRLVIPLGDANGQVIELVQKNVDGVAFQALGTSHLPMLPWARRPSFFPWNKQRAE